MLFAGKLQGDFAVDAVFDVDLALVEKDRMDRTAAGDLPLSWCVGLVVVPALRPDTIDAELAVDIGPALAITVETEVGEGVAGDLLEAQIRRRNGFSGGTLGHFPNQGMRREET